MGDKYTNKSTKNCQTVFDSSGSLHIGYAVDYLTHSGLVKIAVVYINILNCNVYVQTVITNILSLADLSALCASLENRHGRWMD